MDEKWSSQPRNGIAVGLGCGGFRRQEIENGRTDFRCDRALFSDGDALRNRPLTAAQQNQPERSRTA